MTKRAYTVIAVVLVLTHVSQTTQAAPASPAERQSRVHFQKAEERFHAGSFSDALAEYQAGYDLMPLPGFLINIAQCYRRLGDLNQALITYRKFVLVAPDSQFAPEVSKLIDELQTLISDEENAKAGNGSLAKPQREPIHELTLKPMPAVFDGADMSTGSLVSSPTPSPTPESHRRWWLWGTVAATLVVGATVAVFVLKDPGTTTVSTGSLGTLRQ